MKRHVGVSVLAILFVALAWFWLYCGVSRITTAFDDTASEVGGLFLLVVAFLSAALGLGLWDLEEDARRAAISLFGLPSTLGIVGGLISAFHESPPRFNTRGPSISQ
jgi:hypothetical protein